MHKSWQKWSHYATPMMLPIIVHNMLAYSIIHEHVVDEISPDQ